MRQSQNRLKENGILSGYTIVEKEGEGKHLEQHEYEFKNKEDLQRFFLPIFKNVIVFETIHLHRHNLYFWASDGILPFSRDWSHWISVNNYPDTFHLGGKSE